MLCGGASAARPATDETQRIAEQAPADAAQYAINFGTTKTVLAPVLQDSHIQTEIRNHVFGRALLSGISLSTLTQDAGLSHAVVKAQLEEKEGKTFDVFTAVEFKTQVVAGTNYFIKVRVGNEEFMHLRVFKSLPHENEQLSLHSYQASKTKHDELTYF